MPDETSDKPRAPAAVSVSPPQETPQKTTTAEPMDPVFSQAQLAYSQVLYWAVSKNVILEQPDGSWAPCPDCLSHYFRQAWGHWLVPIAGQWSHPVKPPTADLEDLAKVAIMLGADEVWQNSPSTNILQ